jgi:VanZ family protein
LSLRRWWPPLLWLGAILTATSIPGSKIPDLGIPFIDKFVHFGMYAVLGFLVTRAVDGPTRAMVVRSIVIGFIICSAIGAADEWHQTYMPSRSTDPADWLADSAGGLVGALTWATRRRRSLTAER